MRLQERRSCFQISSARQLSFIALPRYELNYFTEYAMRGDILVSHGSTPQYVPIPAKELIDLRCKFAFSPDLKKHYL